MIPEIRVTFNLENYQIKFLETEIEINSLKLEELVGQGNEIDGEVQCQRNVLIDSSTEGDREKKIENHFETTESHLEAKGSGCKVEEASLEVRESCVGVKVTDVEQKNFERKDLVVDEKGTEVVEGDAEIGDDKPSPSVDLIYSETEEYRQENDFFDSIFFDFLNELKDVFEIESDCLFTFPQLELYSIHQVS